MGGKSTSNFSVEEEDGSYFIDFKGKINTNGGGFCTIKAFNIQKPINLSSYDGICVKMRSS
jgi:hypothetical protein